MIRAMRGFWTPAYLSLLAAYFAARGRPLFAAMMLCVVIALVEERAARRWQERHPRIVLVADWTTRALAGAAIVYLLWLLAEELYSA